MTIIVKIFLYPRVDTVCIDPKLKEQLKHFDFDPIGDESTRDGVILLLNDVEQFLHKNDFLKEETG